MELRDSLNNASDLCDPAHNSDGSGTVFTDLGLV
jgi:hypothetical protein